MINEGSWGYGVFDGDAQLDFIAEFKKKVEIILNQFLKKPTDDWSKLALLEFVLHSLSNIKYGKTDITKKLTDEYKKCLISLKNDDEWLNRWNDKNKMLKSLKQYENKLKEYEKISNNNLN